MPKCRKCDEIIETLDYVSSKIEKGVFNGDIYEDSYPDTEIAFSCPICGEQLFDNEEKAREFLSPSELSGDYEKFTNEQLKYILRTVPLVFEGISFLTIRSPRTCRTVLKMYFNCSFVNFS